jgi:hypothetical protein
MKTKRGGGPSRSKQTARALVKKPRSAQVHVPKRSNVNNVRDVAAFIESATSGQSITMTVKHRTSTFTANVHRNKLSINNCIEVELEPDSLYIASYYHSENIETCPELDHSNIFSFFKQLAFLLKYRQVELLDVSTKTFHPCIIKHYIFSWAGKPTFYERFGFKNKHYTELINDTIGKRFDNVLKEDVSNYINKIIADTDLALKDKTRLTWSSTMRDLCLFIYETCTTPTRYICDANKILNKIVDSRQIRPFKFFAEVEPVDADIEPMGIDQGLVVDRRRRRIISSTESSTESLSESDFAPKKSPSKKSPSKKSPSKKSDGKMSDGKKSKNSWEGMSSLDRSEMEI